MLSDSLSLLSKDRRLSQEEEEVSGRGSAATQLPRSGVQDDAEVLLQELTSLAMPELHEELAAYRIPATGDKKELITRLHKHILADAGLGGELQAESPSDSLVAANATGRRLQGEQVFCTCRGTVQSTLYCVKAFYNLMLCYPQCPALCSRAGMGYQACNNAHTLLWLKRLRYHYQECA